jgi:hypothetical protein
MNDCEPEEWRGIPDVKGYEVSNLGRIRSVDRIVWNGYGHHKLKGRVLKQQTLRNGYQSVMFSVGGVTTRVMSHRCVALAFLKEDKQRPCVNHKDGIRHSNKSSNLEWVTPEENMRHGAWYKGDILATHAYTGDLTLIKGSNDTLRRGFSCSSVKSCCIYTKKIHKNHYFRRMNRDEN